MRHRLKLPCLGIVLAVILPAGGPCGARHCWRESPTGVRDVDPERTPDGITRAVLRARRDGGGRLLVKGKGGALGLRRCRSCRR